MNNSEKAALKRILKDLMAAEHELSDGDNCPVDLVVTTFNTACEHIENASDKVRELIGDA